MSRLRPHKEGHQRNQVPLVIVPPAEHKAPLTQGARAARSASTSVEERAMRGRQLTLPRILSLAAIAAVIVAAVSLGGVWLSIGYWVITIGFCIFLMLVAMDYGVEMEEVSLDKAEPEPAAISASEHTAAQSITRSRPQSRANRQTKRRR